jgi:hypothetical protein
VIVEVIIRTEGYQSSSCAISAIRQRQSAVKGSDRRSRQGGQYPSSIGGRLLSFSRQSPFARPLSAHDFFKNLMERAVFTPKIPARFREKFGKNFTKKSKKSAFALWQPTEGY